MSRRKQLLLQNFGPCVADTRGGGEGKRLVAEGPLPVEDEEIRDPFKMALIHMHMSMRDGVPSALSHPFPRRAKDGEVANYNDVVDACRRDNSSCFLLPCSTDVCVAATATCANTELCPYRFMHIGSAGCAYNRGNILKYDITHMLCLCESTKFIFANDSSSSYDDKHIEFLKIKLLDKPEEDISNVLDSCFEFIDACRDKGGRILIHCFQGKSRSAAICSAYLMSRFGLTYDESMLVLKAARPIVEPNVGFVKQLYELEKTWRH